MSSSCTKHWRLPIQSSLLAFFCHITKHECLLLRGNEVRSEPEGPGETEDQRWDTWKHHAEGCVCALGVIVMYERTIDCVFVIQGEKGDVGPAGLPGWSGLIVSQFIISPNILIAGYRHLLHFAIAYLSVNPCH